MVKKQKDVAQEEREEEPQPASAAQSSAYEIWQAGMGAFVKAQAEGGRVFNLLVQENTELQQRTRAKAEGQEAEAADAVSKMADDVGKQAAGAWDKLEQVFEERVARALGAIGVPTRQEVEALTRQIEQLQQLVAQLSGQRAPAAMPAAAPVATPVAPPAAARAARKPAVKGAGVTKPKPTASPAAKAGLTPAAPRKAAARKSGAGSATKA